MKTRSSQMFPGKGVTVETYTNGQGSPLSYFHRTAGMSAMITTTLARDLLKTDGRSSVLCPEVWRAPPDRWRVCLSMIWPAMRLFAYWDVTLCVLGCDSLRTGTRCATSLGNAYRIRGERYIACAPSRRAKLSRRRNPFLDGKVQR